jgi:ORF6N domain
MSTSALATGQVQDVPTEVIESRIFLIRGEKVILSHQIAELYGVAAKVLMQAVKRNRERFPLDFMFQISGEEMEILRSQFVTSSLSRGWGGRRVMPYAFTEQGVAMLSSVLKSPRAVQVNIAIMRTFVHIRRTLTENTEFALRIKDIERRQGEQEANIESIFDVINRMLAIPESPRRSYGLPVPPE